MSTLQSRLDRIQAGFQAQAPAHVLASMARATKDLADSGILTRIPKVGDKLAPFALFDSSGKQHHSADWVAKGPLVISVYRGGWCPYCNSELEALQKSLPVIHELGANLLAISPQLPEKNSEVAARLRLQFPILSDQGNAWSHANGMTFSLPAELREIYRDFGLDIPSFNGDDSWQLPIPARIVVDREGIIRSIEASPDYTQRPEPEVTLQVLRGLADKASKTL